MTIKGRWIYVERANELLIDNDVGMFNETNARYVLRGFGIKRILYLPSAHHEHVVILLRRKVADTIRIALRAACGDDRTRIGIDCRNAEKHGCVSLIISPYDWRDRWRAPDAPATRAEIRKRRPVTFD